MIKQMVLRDVMHYNPRGGISSDMDGVICEDYIGQPYVPFLKDAAPLHIPEFTLKSIITSRLEKFRPETETWLKNHHVKYRKLYMRPNPFIFPIKFKVAILLKEKPHTFWESDSDIAKSVHEITGIRTVCFDNKTIYE
jgi:hypothetical protein